MALENGYTRNTPWEPHRYLLADERPGVDGALAQGIRVAAKVVIFRMLSGRMYHAPRR